MLSEVSLTKRIGTVIRQYLGWCPCTQQLPARAPAQERMAEPGDEKPPAGNYRWYDRIPFDNPWVLSLIAATIGSVAMTLLGLFLGLLGGTIADISPAGLAGTGAGTFAFIFVTCFVVCMLEAR